MTMKLRQKTKYSFCVVLAAIMCFFLTGFSTYAEKVEADELEAIEGLGSTLSVEAVWQEGENLNIDIFDAVAEDTFTIRVNLSEYAIDTEYLSIQAVSLDGEESKVVRVKNPYYGKDPATADENVITGDKITSSAIPTQKDDNKTIIEGNPFTPNGQGQLVDTATEEDGKEFFTITTANGDPFYLIIDKNRNSDNVYFLNTVTEQDLMSLAEKNGNTIEVAEKKTVETQAAEVEPQEKEPEPEPQTEKKDYTLLLIIIAGAIFVVVIYFVKIKPKQEMAQITQGEVYDDDDDNIELENSTYEDYEDEEEYEMQPLVEQEEEVEPPTSYTPYEPQVEDEQVFEEEDEEEPDEEY